MALLIRSLDVGGAERQLVVLAKGLQRLGAEVLVLTFYPGGELHRELSVAGVRTVGLDKRGRWDTFPFFLKLVKELRRYRPDVLYSFLPAANILGVLVKPFVRGLRVVWGVRASNVDVSRYGAAVSWTYALEGRLARFADLLIANAQAGRAHRAGLGLAGDRLIVIANGIDTQIYRRDEAGRRRLRAEWKVSDGEILVGICARLDPMKGHEIFLRAADIAVQRNPALSWRFVCVGEGPADYRRQLMCWCDEFGINADRIIWAGARRDLPAVYSALDIATSASLFGEGFSNAIAEAMACETPCVATDVGDAAQIIGDCGLVVPPNDPVALAAAWCRLAALPDEDRRRFGRRERARIAEKFPVETMVDATARALGLVRAG